VINLQNHLAPISAKDVSYIVEPLVSFIENSPLINLEDLQSFTGAGVYALYLCNPVGTHYAGIIQPEYPIYIGKAVPKGSRQGKSSVEGKPLFDRLRKHASSIRQVSNLNLAEIKCRFMIFGEGTTDMIVSAESYIIKHFNPLWNSHIDGFGINAPGKGRYDQQPSEWDTIHSGRYYASQLRGQPRDSNLIHEKIKQYKMR